MIGLSPRLILYSVGLILLSIGGMPSSRFSLSSPRGRSLSLSSPRAQRRAERREGPSIIESKKAERERGADDFEEMLLLRPRGVWPRERGAESPRGGRWSAWCARILL
eukprot:scaffold1769_cov30-Tisochrysis_lutea.AAC.1